MGIYDRARDLPRLRALYTATMTADPADLWVKVVDVATGRIVAGSNWRVYVNGPPEDRPMDPVPWWLEGEARERAARFVEAADAVRLREMRGTGFMRAFPPFCRFLFPWWWCR